MDNGTAIHNSAIDVHCEKCGKLFYIDMYEAEEMGKEGGEYLCASCALLQQEPTGDRPQFEYLVSHIFAEMGPMESELNRLGVEGWELVMKIQDNLVFKRSRIE